MLGEAPVFGVGLVVPRDEDDQHDEDAHAGAAVVQPEDFNSRLVLQIDKNALVIYLKGWTPRSAIIDHCIKET